MQGTTTQLTSSMSLELSQNSKEGLGPLLPINVVLSIITLTLISFVIQHYYSQKGRFVPSMYMLISTSDGLATLFLLTQYLLMWLIDREYITDPILIGCSITIIVAATGISWRVSVFSNVVLSVTRTIQIKRPFQRVKGRVVYVCIAVYAIFWVIVATFDVIILLKENDLDNYYSYSAHPIIGNELSNLFANKIAVQFEGCEQDDMISCYNETAGVSMQLVFMTVSYLLPVLIVLICMVIQIQWVSRPRPVEGSPNNQRHVTITILQITVLFFVCHTAPSISNFISEYSHSFPDVPYLFNSALYTTLPLINAALSPVIIMSRSRELRNTFKIKLSVVSNSLASRIQTVRGSVSRS